jgi:ribonuclease D
VNVAKGRARVKWLARPLSRELLLYAEQDVAHLVRLGHMLLDKLRGHDRVDWAMQESIVPASVFDVPAEEMGLRMARSGHMDPLTYNVLVELLRWREDRAKTANLPRAWVAGNEVLVSLAKVRPETLDDLRSFRGLNAKEIDRNGNRILDAIADGVDAPRDVVKLPERGPSPTENEDHVLDLIKTYVAYLAARHEVAPRYLINTGRGFSLLQHANDDESEWVRQEILSEPSRRLIGAELKALLHGKRALVLRDRKVVIISL